MKDKKGSWLFAALVAVLSIVLIALVVVAVSKGQNGTKNPSGSTATGSDVESGNSQLDTGTETETESETESEDDPLAGLLPDAEGAEVFVMFGVDSRTGQLGKGTHSDSIMLVRVDHDMKEVRVVSIYRDCLVYQQNKGYKKLTEAYFSGGPTYAIQTINENFDFNLEKYCTMNFNAVGDLIDQVGGVEMDITSAEVQYINSYIDETNRVRGTNSAHITEAGTYHLDGTQAVAYSRIRYTAGADYKRTERQRTILFKVFEKTKTLSLRERLNIVEDMLGETNTNYTQDELLVLIYYMSEYKITTMTAYPQVLFSGIVSGSWVEVPCTLVDMNTELHRILLNEENYTPSARVQELSDTLRSKVKGPNIDQRD